MEDNTTQKFKHEQIQYIEFLSSDIAQAKEFYRACFGWEFTDYGTAYTAFNGDYVDGGFAVGKSVPGSILVILYSKDIEATKTKVIEAGGIITQDIFSFPGGKRFQFKDLDGYELAVWTT